MSNPRIADFDLTYLRQAGWARRNLGSSAMKWIVGVFAFALLMTPAVLMAKGVAWIFGGNETVYSWTLIPLGVATIFILLVLFPVIGALALSR
jgi:hypothetical protein